MEVEKRCLVFMKSMFGFCKNLIRFVEKVSYVFGP